MGQRLFELMLLGMPKIRKIQMGDEKRLISLFQILTGNEIIINTVNLIADNSVTCMVIEENDELIGFGALVVCKVPTKGEVGRIEDVVIGQNHQGKGLGKMLMRELIEIAKEKKVSKIFLTSNPARVAARKLYESVGFTKGITDQYFLSL